MDKLHKLDFTRELLHDYLVWLEQAAGESLRSAELLENDPHAACEEASRNFLPRDWNLDYFTPRRELEAA